MSRVSFWLLLMLLVAVPLSLLAGRVWIDPLTAGNASVILAELRLPRALLAVTIGGGLGAFKGKVWRIGLMGYGSRANNVYVLLSALEELLAEQKHKFTHGASIAAANAVYAKA